MDFDKREYADSGNFHNTIKLQLSGVIATVLARKVRVSLPDQSSLVLQSLGQLSEKSNSDQAQACQRQNFVVSEASEKTPKNKSDFPKLSTTEVQSTLLLTNAAGLSEDKHSLTSCDHSDDARTHPTSKNLASSYSMTHERSIAATSVHSNMPATADADFRMRSDIVSHFLRRHHSHTEHLEVAGYKMEASDDSVFRPTILPSSLPSDKTNSMVVSQPDKNNVGFGILSRTCQFGAWLTKATGGVKMEVTKKDLNALAPNSF